MHQITNIYFVIKLYTFRASSSPIIRSYLLYTRQSVRFVWVIWPLPSRVRLELRSNLTLLENGHQNLRETYQCRIYSRKFLMMGKEVARNM